MRRTAFGALCAALIVVFLGLSSLFPSLDLSLAALAALVVYVVLLEFGKKAAALTFITSALLSILILPDKNCALFYTFFFGWYPFLRAILAHVYLWLGWVIKIGSATFMAGIFYLFFAVLFPRESFSDFFQISSVVLFFIAFVLYDIGLSRLVFFYSLKIRPKLFGKN